MTGPIVPVIIQPSIGLDFTQNWLYINHMTIKHENPIFQVFTLVITVRYVEQFVNYTKKIMNKSIRILLEHNDFS